MKLALCQDCRHKLFSFTYEPQFCRECGGRGLRVYSGLEWLILIIVAVLTVKFL